LRANASKNLGHQKWHSTRVTILAKIFGPHSWEPFSIGPLHWKDLGNDTWKTQAISLCCEHGCQMLYFQSKNTIW
jgi:hypothetical protein